MRRLVAGRTYLAVSRSHSDAPETVSLQAALTPP